MYTMEWHGGSSSKRVASFVPAFLLLLCYGWLTRSLLWSMRRRQTRYADDDKGDNLIRWKLLTPSRTRSDRRTATQAESGGYI